ncbi:MAG: hypothetical protein RMJ98_16830 [Myxococcales bacterium]|nr:hypothetical protein [Polyangiaceae bacterium]MDW8250961.1 hypothetical protein [Myxococcales bacterium]
MKLGCSLLSLARLLTFLGVMFSSPMNLPEARAADEESTAKIRTIFQDALQLEAGGNYAGALAKFQEVAALKRTPNVLFHIAFCQEKLGRLVAAVGGYRITILEGANDPKSAMAVQAAQEALAALEKRIPSLTILRGKGAARAKITLDGTELGAASLGTPQQVDPGSHAVEATLQGKVPFKEEVNLEEGESKTIEVVLKDKDEEGGAPPASSTSGPGKLSPSRSVIPYLALGGGAGSLAASGLFFYLRSAAISDLDRRCIQNVCPTDLRATSDHGKRMTLLGNITLGLGVVGVSVGTVLLLTSKPIEPAVLQAYPRSFDVVFSPGREGASASMVGSF